MFFTALNLQDNDQLKWRKVVSSSYGSTSVKENFNKVLLCICEIEKKSFLKTFIILATPKAHKKQLVQSSLRIHKRLISLSQQQLGSRYFLLL